MFENTFLYPAYVDDSTFFLKNKNSSRELMNTINLISSFTCLKQNLSKCVVGGIGTLKGVKETICRIKCIDLTKKAIKILEVFFSYEKVCSLETTLEKQY